MTPADIRSIAGRVYVDEIVGTGLDKWWHEDIYAVLIAQIPRHDASMAEQIAFAGDLPWEPGDMERPA
jgi:hypothetical protein